MKTLILAISFLFVGCAHYDPLVIEQLSTKTQHVQEITKETCDDFYKGAKAFAEGPEKAYPWFGRAREIDAAHVIMVKQGAVCYYSESKDLSLNSEERILKAFKRTWTEAEEVIK